MGAKQVKLEDEHSKMHQEDDIEHLRNLRLTGGTILRLIA